MALHNINPTDTLAWKRLQNHFREVSLVHLRDFFRKDLSRKERLTVKSELVTFDYSKNRVSQETLDLLLNLANESRLKDAIEKYFTGDKINVNENRAVLHTALRSTSDEKILVDGKDIKPTIQTALRKIRAFSNKVISGKWKGYSGKPITDIVNLGLGGSELGPEMAVKALGFYRNHLNIHFVSNVDGDHVLDVLKNLNPETTLFVIVSKSFTTSETITNSETVKDWFLRYASIFDVPKHFVAVTSSVKSAQNFGVDKKNVFPMWDWVGGRFSVWSSVGLSVCLSVGFDNFKLFLEGAEQTDIHFRYTDFKENIPVLMAMLGVWYTNFFNSETELVVPYTQYLVKFPSFLQQASMESNGKSVDRNGNAVPYQTGSIIWGSTGTNMQHSFMQLVHQGTKFIPTDFIGFKSSLHNLDDHHKKLMANLCAQAEALAFGQTKEEVHLELKVSNQKHNIEQLLPYKLFGGNRPSSTLLFDKLTPKTLGVLIALYEHKIFVQGVIWNIFSFDQFGVELGKELARRKID